MVMFSDEMIGAGGAGTLFSTTAGSVTVGNIFFSGNATGTACVAIPGFGTFTTPFFPATAVSFATFGTRVDRLVAGTGNALPKVPVGLGNALFNTLGGG